MKYIFILLAVVVLLIGCEDKYDLNTNFTIPTELTSPASVDIDVSITAPIVLSWKGGGAEDGSYVTYEVFFDKKGGDFSTPLFKSFSDYGTDNRFQISHEDLNVIARQAGIKPESSGELIWTVTASKGGEVRPTNIVKTITVSRGEGIDNIPDKLYLKGDGAENGGTTDLLFRESSDGVFVIYSKVSAGGVKLEGTVGDQRFDYFVDGGKLKEGEGILDIPANAAPYRIIVDYNSSTVKTEKISNVRAIWGVNFGIIGQLNYAGNGKFKTDNCFVEFVEASRPQTNPPSWLSWVEERYYFIANVDGTDKCWGRLDNISGERPSANEPIGFYELKEFTWSQWDHLWKMSGSLDQKTCTITIDTNKDNMMVHLFSNVR